MEKCIISSFFAPNFFCFKKFQTKNCSFIDVKFPWLEWTRSFFIYPSSFYSFFNSGDGENFSERTTSLNMLLSTPTQNAYHTSLTELWWAVPMNKHWSRNPSESNWWWCFILVGTLTKYYRERQVELVQSCHNEPLFYVLRDWRG